jgi:transposase InsO family protein
VGPCTDDELVDYIRRILEASSFPGEGYRKVWARLRYQGIRTSPRRVLRLMRAHGLLAPTRHGHPHGPKAHDGTIIPTQVDTMWGTDMTATYTRQDGQGASFIAVDHYSAGCVGIHAATQGTRFEALEPIRQGIRTAFGAFEQGLAQGLALRHDHGSQYMSHVFQEELRFLGIASSPAFVREPEGNGCAERFIRTLKENLLWLTPFDTIEDLRLALCEFQRRYNETWLIGRHGYKTPAQVRHEQCCLLATAA